jgi:hypothetical protein
MASTTPKPKPLTSLSPSSQNSKTASPTPSSVPSSATSSFVQVDGMASPVKESLGSFEEEDFGEGEDRFMSAEEEGWDGTVKKGVDERGQGQENDTLTDLVGDVPSSPFVSMVTSRTVSESTEVRESTRVTEKMEKAEKRRSMRFPVKVTVSGDWDGAADMGLGLGGGTVTGRSRMSLSPRKMSETRSPRKNDAMRGRGDISEEVERTLRFNEGLTRAVERLEEDEGDESVIHHEVIHHVVEEELDGGREDTLGLDGVDEGLSTIYQGPRTAGQGLGDETLNIEGDTCLSTFSAVPNADMTTFARLGDKSPTKTGPGGWTPGKQLRNHAFDATPRNHHRGGSTRDSDGFGSASPTPRRGAGQVSRESEDTNLMDFTDQFNQFAQSTGRQSPRRRTASPTKTNDLSNFLSSRRAPSPGKTMPSTPYESRTLANLLDFDIPPAPTPRSVPSITARELESLKSSFLSQISSLRASLNGKEAEVNSLKDAVGDAERRVGEAAESVREEVSRREQLEVERAEWERRGREMEGVLRSVKDEIITSEKEREDYRERLDASEKRRDELEGKLDFVSSQLVASREGSGASGTSDGSASPNANGSASNKEIQDAVERVARELHALYKGKHETKVAALKKSYESRWEKRVKEMEAKLSSAEQENERLKTERDATMSGVVAGTLVHPVDPEVEKAKLAKEEEERRAAQEMRAKIAGLETEISSVKRDQETLLAELEQERVEKGELVAAVDELLEMQSEASMIGGANAHTAKGAAATVESFKNSVRGLRAPGFGLAAPATTPGGESRIARAGAAAFAGGRGRSGSGEGREASGKGYGFGGGGARGIMGNIERMGRGGGGGA